MTVHQGASSAWQGVITEVHVGVSGAWQQLDEVHVGLSSSWEEVYPGVPAPAFASGFPRDKSSTDQDIEIQMELVDLFTTYDLYYKVGSSMAGDPVANADGSFLGLTPAQIEDPAIYTHATGQSHGTVVYYQARGYIGTDVGGFGTEASATVQYRVPGAPASCSATSPTPGSGSTTVSWPAGSPDNESQYNVYIYRKPCGGAYSLNDTQTNPADDLDKVIAIITDGGYFYKFKVSAENAAGESSLSPYSNEVSDNSAPAAPTGVSLTYVGVADDTTQLKLSWTAPASGYWDEYDLEIVEYSGSFSGTPTDTASGGATTYTFTGLADNTRFKARIRGSGGGCVSDGSWSSQADSWTAPADPQITGGGWVSGYPRAKPATDDVWQFSAIGTDADTYEFYGHTGAFTIGPTYLLTSQASGSYDWGSRSPDTQYYGQVRFIHSAAVGSPHSDASVDGSQVAKYTHVETPQGLNAGANYDNCPTDLTLNVTWDNDNTDGVDRNESMTVGYYDGTWHDTAKSAGSTSHTFSGVSAASTQVRAKYDSESTYATDSFVECPE